MNMQPFISLVTTLALSAAPAADETSSPTPSEPAAPATQPAAPAAQPAAPATQPATPAAQPAPAVDTPQQATPASGAAPQPEAAAPPGTAADPGTVPSSSAAQSGTTTAPTATPQPSVAPQPGTGPQPGWHAPTTVAPPPPVVPPPSAPAPAVDSDARAMRHAGTALLATGSVLVPVGFMSMLLVAAPAGLVKRSLVRRAELGGGSLSSRETLYRRARRADDVMEGAFWVGAAAVVVGVPLIITGAVLKGRARASQRVAASADGLLIRF